MTRTSVASSTWAGIAGNAAAGGNGSVAGGAGDVFEAFFGGVSVGARVGADRPGRPGSDSLQMRLDLERCSKVSQAGHRRYRGVVRPIARAKGTNGDSVRYPATCGGHEELTNRAASLLGRIDVAAYSHLPRRQSGYRDQCRLVRAMADPGPSGDQRQDLPTSVKATGCSSSRRSG